MKILSISDVELGFIYSPQILERFKDVDLVISCGDLPYYYLEYIISTLNRPLYYVRGNHASEVEVGTGGDRREPWGGIDLHRRIANESGLLLAGIEGSVNYNNGPHQYTQTQMWGMVYELVPRLLINRLRYGRYLDVLVTHAPPYRIHDDDDPPHVGIKAFRWLIRTFRPAYHFHGHIHVYRKDRPVRTLLGPTMVVNTYGYQETTLSADYFRHPSD
jgi:Icc-related predicted phosphoesterase